MNEPTPPPRGSLPPEPEDRRAPAEPRPADGFRWQALFQRSTDAIFLLDRQQRLRFVNQAWESLTGLTSSDVHLLACRRQRPPGADDLFTDILAHVLCPPPEVVRGEFSRVRRRVPAADGDSRQWWDIEFLPLRSGDHAGGFVGRVLPVVEEFAKAVGPLPERLVDLRERVVRRYDFSLLDSLVPAVRRLGEQVRLAASLAVPVLIVGERGSGKETLARIIHYRGPHRDRALAALDCARLPADAISAVLFGGRGPADKAPAGFYLRDVTRLPRDLQLRLCNHIAAGAGSRVLAGCGTAPAEELRSGRMVGELYTAFTLVLEVPPLRERAGDLSALVREMLERAAEEGGVPSTGLAPAARDIVHQYPWPGNLRELYETLSDARRRAAGRMIDAADLPAALRLRSAAGPAPPAERPLPLDTLLEQAERRLIELALRRAKGHRGRAAEILGIWRARLLRRIEALELTVPGAKDEDE
jgi:PAS domain S-box-containing protein